jgi:hypothetical protein
VRLVGFIKKQYPNVIYLRLSFSNGAQSTWPNSIKFSMIESLCFDWSTSTGKYGEKRRRTRNWCNIKKTSLDKQMTDQH